MAGEPTASELAREVERLQREILNLIADLKNQSYQQSQSLADKFDRYVLKEVYLADLTALRERLGRQEEEAAGARQTARNALWGTAGAVLAAIISVIISYVLTKSGGSH